MKRFVALLLCLFALFLSSCSNTMQKSDGVTPLAPDNEIPHAIGLLNPDSEVRGVWIATVGNINFPSKQGLSAEKLKKELEDIVATCKKK